MLGDHNNEDNVPKCLTIGKFIIYSWDISIRTR